MFAAAVLALLGGFVFLQVVRSVEPLGLDQGLFACFGRWVPRGWLPYRDLFDSKPPLFLYTWTAAWALGGSPQSVWCFEAGWLAATMGLAFLLGRRLRDRWVGLLAAAFFFVGIWAPGFGGYWSRVQAEELLALPVLGAALVALAAGDRPRLALWTGVLTGLAGLYKIPSMAVAGAWPLYWLAVGGLRPAAARTAWMAAGLVLPWLLAAGWFAAHGALGDLWQATIVYHRHNAAFIAPPWGEVLAGCARTFGGAVPGLMLAAAVGLAVLWSRDRPRAALMTAWLGLTAVAVVLQRQLAGYQHLLVIPPLALAAAYGVVALARGLITPPWSTRAAALALTLALGLFAARGAGEWRRVYGPELASRRGPLARTAWLRSLERGPFSPAVEEEAARYLRARTRPGDGVLVWGLSPGIYALADRHPVTRYPFHKILMTEAPLSQRIPGLPARRAELMRRLHADPPAFILVGTGDANGFEPEESVASLRRFAALDAFVHDGYRPEDRLGRFVVLRRIAP